jgi:hypothetical protein
VISKTATIAIIAIRIKGDVSFGLMLSEVRLFGSVVGDCEVEFGIGDVGSVGLGVSLGEVDGIAVGVVRTGAEG